MRRSKAMRSKNKLKNKDGKELFETMLQQEECHGHPRFYELLLEEGQLHSDKNHDYATGGDPLGNFKRRASIYALYPGLDLSDPAIVSIIDLMKQLDAYLWMASNKHKAKVEGKGGRMCDVSVYANINVILEEEKDE